jgi:hypothetical protein
MKNSMALVVPSWKISFLTYRLTVYLQVDFTPDKEAVKGKDPITF